MLKRNKLEAWTRADPCALATSGHRCLCRLIIATLAGPTGVHPLCLLSDYVHCSYVLFHS